jgi:hypothetical protein
MASVTFTREEIDRLTDKLGSLASKLTEPEWELLLAIFAAAADKVGASQDPKSATLPGIQSENPRESTARQLRDQLLRAYAPGRTPPDHEGDSVTP